MSKLKELRERQGAINEELTALTSGEGFTDEQRTQFDTLEDELKVVEADIVRFEKVETQKRSNPTPTPKPVVLDKSQSEERELSKFSFTKFLRDASSKGGLTGFELEMHQEAVNEMRESKADHSDGAVGIPLKVLRNIGFSTSQKRAGQNATTDADGGYLVQTTKQGLIEPFVPASIVSRMGATVLEGLVGDLSMPKDTTLFSMAWETETGANDDTTKTLGEVLLTPKRMAGRADISRRLLAQTSLDIETYMKNQFIIAVNSTLDAAAVNGSGSSNQPTGILATSGIGSVAGGTNGLIPTWGNIVSLEKEVDIDNALQGNLAYLTTPQVKSVMKQTLKSSGVSGYIWDANEMNGYNAMTSTNVPSTLTKGSASGICHAVVFGNWSELLIGMWGGVFILVDPYTQAGTSQVRIHTELQCDVAVKRAASFAAMLDALVA